MRGGGANPHLVAYSFERIALEERLRTAGVNRLLVTDDQAEARALRAVERDLRRLADRGRMSMAQASELGLNMVRSLTTQLYNTPFDLFLQSRQYADFPLVRDAQFGELARQMAEYAQVVAPSVNRDMLPPRFWQANAAMSAALALAVDDLYRGRTAYADAYGPSGMLQAGRTLYGIHRGLAAGDSPDAVFRVVDAWADELHMRDWYVWRADDHAAPTPVQERAQEEVIGHRRDPEVRAKQEGGPTNPDYLAQPAVQAAASFFMVSALKRFGRMTDDAIFAVAAEIALIGMGGINYIAGEQEYTLKTLPDEKFSGLQLLCLQYVGFKLTRPDIDPMIPLDEAYSRARAMFDAGGE